MGMGRFVKALKILDDFLDDSIPSIRMNRASLRKPKKIGKTGKNRKIPRKFLHFHAYSVTDRPPARIMDSVCADTNLNNAESNNNAMETNNLGETTTTTDAVNAEQPQTYDDLFVCRRRRH